MSLVLLSTIWLKVVDMCRFGVLQFLIQGLSNDCDTKMYFDGKGCYLIGEV